MTAVRIAAVTTLEVVDSGEYEVRAVHVEVFGSELRHLGCGLENFVWLVC